MGPLQNLGLRTDLELIAREGRVDDRQDHIYVASPDAPDYFWGNLLVFRQPPGPGDHERWTKIFRSAFAHDPRVRHMTFTWDDVTGDAGSIQEFLRAGFELQRSVVLTVTAKSLHPPKHAHPEARVRPLRTDGDWRTAVDNQILCHRGDLNRDLFAPFIQRRMSAARKLTEAGHGHWYGAFLNDRLVADCGLFTFADLGRFQAVGTHPDFRRQGLCATLIHQTALQALAGNPKRTLIIVANPDAEAARVYRSVGFTDTQIQIGVSRWPKEDWTKES